MRELLRRLRFLFHREQFDRELDEEMRHHLALKTEEQGAGAARRQFGNVTLLKEDSRAMWSWTLWEQFTQDVRYSLRTMAANPLFAAMAVLSLALGIGANTAIYSFMDAVLLRSLPVQHPGQLVVLNWSAKSSAKVVHGIDGTEYEDKKRGPTSPDYPFAAYEFLHSNQRVLSSLFAYASAYEVNLVVQNQAEVTRGLFVSGGFYSGLGVSPAAGRLIIGDDDRIGAPAVAVIGYKYWQRRFLSSPAAVGQSIRINNVPFTIIGVSAPGFFGVDAGKAPDVFIPLHSAPLLNPNPADDTKQKFFDNNFYWVEMMGRLRPDVGKEQAQTALAAKFRQFVMSTATTQEEKKVLPELWLEDGAGGIDSLRRQYSEPLFVLMAMSGLILIIACANIANLLLARATARRREMAVRLSLGAGRMRVIRQLLTESALLSLIGGALGLLVALWGIRSITWLLANGSGEFTLHASLNWEVLGFTLALALITGIVFGLAPAMQATRIDLTPALKETRASAPAGRGRRIGLSQALVASQIALSLLLVFAAGLFVRTLSNIHSVELGFNQENILLFSLNARQAGYKDAALGQFYGNLLGEFRRIPGVRNAGLSGFPLVSQYWSETGLTIPGAPKTEERKTCIMPVDPSFLDTMQIPILLGRGIEQRDITSPKVAVVTELFAKKFFAGESPVGRRIGLGDDKSPADIQIVGVAKTTLYNSVKEKETPPVAYVPYTQNLSALGGVTFELRAGDPLALVNSVRGIVHRASASVPVTEVATQSARIDQTISQERTFAELCTGFAVLALLISCVGLYGTMAYAVARRTNEIGIRMALGAERGRILWMVLRQVFALAAVGLAIGLAIAFATERFVASFLFGMKANDPLALSASIAILIAAAAAAGYLPAWRASRTDPMAALRHE